MSIERKQCSYVSDKPHKNQIRLVVGFINTN